MQQFQLKYNNSESRCSSWSIFTNGAAGIIKKQRLKTGFLNGAIELLADAAVPRGACAHSSSAALGVALTAHFIAHQGPG